MGGGGGGGGIIPFNMAALAPFMPSVFKGPYNAQGAYKNEQNLASKFPWITPPEGQFQGAQPGQFAGSSTGTTGPFGGLPGVTGFPPPPNPSPPIPPTVQAQVNPQAMATNQVTGMQPIPLQAIIAALGAQSGQPPAPTGGGQ